MSKRLPRVDLLLVSDASTADVSNERTDLASNNLSEALESQGIDLPPSQCGTLEEYCQLLWDWNQKLNLTRHLDYDTFASRDVLDSVKLASVLQQNELVLDVGSGGGVPGLLVAILRPDVSMTLCDSIEKKTRALEDIASRLRLNVPVVKSRLQDLLPNAKFNSLIARAVGPVSKLLRWVQPHWSQFDRMLLIKGPRWVNERGEARHHGLMKRIEMRRVLSYPMPGTESESVILSLTRK